MVPVGIFYPGPDMQADSVENLNIVNHKIAGAARAAGRAAEDIHLVAVSKVFPAEAISPVLTAGQRIFGENRVQEAQAKWPKLRQRFRDIELHLIGPLQSNKAMDAVQIFDVIETVDRPKIAKALAKAMQKSGKTPRLFVQVNTGEEPQKAGIMPAETQSFLKTCREDYGLQIDGLMCIPPIDKEAALHFSLLEKLARENAITSLSMGMSADYETAIALGATYVRVGSAIFGARNPNR